MPLLPASSGNAENRNCASGLLSSPRLMRLSLIGRDDATKEWRLIWLDPPKMMPF